MALAGCHAAISKGKATHHFANLRPPIEHWRSAGAVGSYLSPSSLNGPPVLNRKESQARSFATFVVAEGGQLVRMPPSTGSVIPVT